MLWDRGSDGQVESSKRRRELDVIVVAFLDREGYIYDRAGDPLTLATGRNVMGIVQLIPALNVLVSGNSMEKKRVCGRA